MNSTTESEKNASAPDVSLQKTKRTPAKKAKPAKKAGRAKKAATKPKANRANKKAEVIAMMKRALRRDTGRDPESYGLAAAYSARIR